jgi:hypothetical protein
MIELIVGKRTHFSAARLTIGRDDGADDFKQFVAAVDGGSAVRAAGVACRMSAGECWCAG